MLPCTASKASCSAWARTSPRRSPRLPGRGPSGGGRTSVDSNRAHRRFTRIALEDDAMPVLLSDADLAASRATRPATTPLAGLRVIDAGQIIAGPFGPSLLADF